MTFVGGSSMTLIAYTPVPLQLMAAVKSEAERYDKEIPYWYENLLAKHRRGVFDTNVFNADARNCVSNTKSSSNFQSATELIANGFFQGLNDEHVSILNKCWIREARLRRHT